MKRPDESREMPTQRPALGDWNAHIRAGQFLSRRYRIDSGELEDQIAVMHPDALHCGL